jgi:hypothetical protein
LGEKKGWIEGKLHNCKSTPVQPVSAIRGEGEEGGGVMAETEGWWGTCAAVGERELLEREKLTGIGWGGKIAVEVVLNCLVVARRGKSRHRGWHR